MDDIVNFASCGTLVNLDKTLSRLIANETKHF